LQVVNSLDWIELVPPAIALVRSELHAEGGADGGHLNRLAKLGFVESLGNGKRRKSRKKEKPAYSATHDRPSLSDIGFKG
jgi:hypothetical protein